ncbi:MAG: type II secretion system F family protein [Clostridiales bacterium]|nr:type II secretion system F family protein [Clostridiales bacterium]
MPYFSYRGVNQIGDSVSGVLEASDAEAARSSIRSRGYRVDRISSASRLKLALLPGVSALDIAVMCRQLYAVINSDIPLTDGMIMLEEQTGSVRLRLAMHSMYESISGGKTLAEAMQLHPDVFPSYLIHMVGVGEDSGSLDIVLGQMAEYYEKENEIRHKMRTATLYPSMLTVLMIWVIGLLVVRIMPMFESMLTSMGGELPAITRGLLTLSDFVVRYAFILMVALAVLVVLAIWFSGTRRGRYLIDYLKVHLPGIGAFYSRVVTARFARSLAILLESGVPTALALGRMDNLIGNAWVERRLEKSREQVASGQTLASSIRGIGVFMPMLLRMLVVGERTGSMGKMLMKSAGFYDDEVDRTLRRLTTVIEPVLIFILSVIVGIILLSVMMPLINIMSVIG